MLPLPSAVPRSLDGGILVDRCCYWNIAPHPSRSLCASPNADAFMGRIHRVFMSVGLAVDFTWQATRTVDLALLDGIQEDLMSSCFLFEYLSNQHVWVPRPEKGEKHGQFPCSHILCFSPRGINFST